MVTFRFITQTLAASLLACVGSLLQAQELSGKEMTASVLFNQGVAYENGEGVQRDLAQAAALYCEASRLGSPDAQYNLGWMYVNGRGVERDDAMAAFLFRAALEQGVVAAQRILTVVGASGNRVPECMKKPVIAPIVAAAERPTPGVDFKAVAPKKIYDLVHSMAPVFQVEPQLVLAIISAESNFDTLALSPKRAQGLMQLIPETSERFNVVNAFDPSQNIRGGMTYLRWLLAYFQGDVALVAAAYNSGEGTVERYRGIPPYQETQSYVKRILAAVGNRRHPFDEKVARPSAIFGQKNSANALK